MSSFATFALGALIPLVPWLFARGTVAVVASVAVSVVAAIAVGAALAAFTRRSWWRSSSRQLAMTALPAAVTYGVGAAVGSPRHSLSPPAPRPSPESARGSSERLPGYPGRGPVVPRWASRYMRRRGVSAITNRAKPSRMRMPTATASHSAIAPTPVKANELELAWTTGIGAVVGSPLLVCDDPAPDGGGHGGRR